MTISHLVTSQGYVKKLMLVMGKMDVSDCGICNNIIVIVYLTITTTLSIIIKVEIWNNTIHLGNNIVY